MPSAGSGLTVGFSVPGAPVRRITYSLLSPERRRVFTYFRPWEGYAVNGNVYASCGG
jgi:hypothetical protein